MRTQDTYGGGDVTEVQSAGVTCSNSIDTGALSVFSESLFLSGCLYLRLVILLVLQLATPFSAIV